MVAATILTAPAFAQDSAPAETATATGDDEIVVTGFRGSLQTAQTRKQNADTIVDSVTAEDIGALPDRSVTETLQRIPGISINRFAAGVDPDHFSVEGSGVVVRGLTYVRSEFNGREGFTANNGRALSFADVPSELLGGVDVFKSPSADRIEGGIAGVVNLRTRVPFDKKGLVLAGSLELNYGDFAERASPTVSVVASNTWDTGIGEIGLLGSFSYSQLYSRADRLQVSSFRTRDAYSDGTRTDVIPFAGATQIEDVIFPRGAVMGTQEFDRERYGYSAAAQWRSNDGSMEATFQFLRSDARQAWTERTVEIATDNVASNGDSRAVAGTSLNFDDSGLFESGFITGPTGWRGDQTGDNTAIGNARTPILGLQSNNIRRDHTERNITSDYSANFQWQVSDRLRVNLDYQHVDSKVTVRDNTMWLSTYQDVFIQMNGASLPDIRFQPPQNCDPAPCTGNPGFDPNYPAYFTGTHQSYVDPFNSFYRSAMDHFEDSGGNSDALRFDAELEFPEEGFLKAVKVGGRWAERDQTARFSTYNWGVLSEQWGNNGPVWLDDNVDGITGGTGGTPPQGYEQFYFANFFGGQAGNPLQGQGRLFYAGNTVTDYEGYVAYGNAIVNEWKAGPQTGGSNGWTSLFTRPGVIAGTPYLPGEVNQANERNVAAYVMARFGADFANGWNLSGNIGVRYTDTRRISSGFQQFPTTSGLPSVASCADQIQEILNGTSTTLSPGCAIPAADRAALEAFSNGALVANDVKINYRYWLPSFNAKLEVGGGLQFRAAYFKGVAPPDFGYVRNYFPVSVSVVQNTDANGNLIPIVVNPDGTIVPGSIRLQGTFNAGNPTLRPTTADNFDLTAEYYFGNVGQLSVSLFYKRLKNVLTNDTRRVTFTNNGQSFEAIVTSPVNSDDIGKIKGFEVSYQQVFDFLPGFLQGFGIQANYTYVHSKGVPQSTLSATDPDVGAGRQPTLSGDNFPLQGLSKHQFNITPFIDIGPLSMRASYNWRSRYLLTLRDVITPFDPIFQRPYGQLDASILVAVTDNFKLGIQGVNLLNSITKTEAAVADQNGDPRLVPRGWYMNDRRYTITARFNF